MMVLKNKGFTLIELLVVVAIIGVLASVVLASLNSARNRSVEASIKENFHNLRNQAEVIYTLNSCYSDGESNGNFCHPQGYNIIGLEFVRVPFLSFVWLCWGVFKCSYLFRFRELL